MIGFVKAEEITKNNIRKPKDFLTSKILLALSQSSIIKSPVSFNEIKNIYEWSCNFTHTGEKDFVWLRLVALEYIDVLFKHPHNFHTISIGYKVISYLQDGKNLQDLEAELNDIFKNDSRYHVTLAFEKMDEDFEIYDKGLDKYM